jgi:ATP-dependent helicase/nuclease subunit A
MTAALANPSYPQKLAASPTVSAWVSASAGTGKTKVLTDRLLNLMLSGYDPGKILCLTFTKAAAAEMQTRLFQRLRALGFRLTDEELKRPVLLDLWEGRHYA